MKRIIDQECFSCKEIPLQDGFSRNQIACPEMTYLICEGCKYSNTMEKFKEDELMTFHSIGQKSPWSCCHYNQHKVKFCWVDVSTF